MPGPGPKCMNPYGFVAAASITSQMSTTRESHIPRCLDEIAFDGRKVLEIGLGLGADAEQIIGRGGRWTGIALTAESVDRVKTRMELRNLPCAEIRQATVLELPFADDSVDVVFSHGVLHHVPDILPAQSEVARVLRPSGEAVVMLCARYSLNYLVSVSVVRRLGLIAMYGLERADVHVGRPLRSAGLGPARGGGSTPDAGRPRRFARRAHSDRSAAFQLIARMATGIVIVQIAPVESIATQSLLKPPVT